ncbi:hypothetical protein HU200_027225 [Digitaria exilis]|uniref:Uncharacterized protein n=1 Tax=Digitaria exilis TaxID=1010633 RepID=A0A835ETZ2_9POAL|nr:hypothetical protein HU200_027225 [Digitaria exilis]
MLPVQVQGSLNIEEEYNNTLRAQSAACFFLSKKHRSDEEMAALLGNHQDLISPMLQNMAVHRRTYPEIELAMVGYFDASAEASEMCRQLLGKIRSTQSNYESMDSFLASMSSDGTASTASSDQPAALVRSNPFCTMTRSNFRQIHDRYSSILQSIRSSHRRVARKLKVAMAVKKLWRTCLAMACGGAAIAAAAHLLFLGMLIGPVAAGLICPTVALKRRLTAARKKKRSTSWTTSLLRLREQLDTAAKGTYVLGRDLDTVTHLVLRLSDGIERENAMAWRCVETVGDSRCPVEEMVSELRRSCSSSRRLADELEEHVWLCLATIQRARLLVIQEISNH